MISKLSTREDLDKTLFESIHKVGQNNRKFNTKILNLLGIDESIVEIISNAYLMSKLPCAIVYISPDLFKNNRLNDLIYITYDVEVINERDGVYVLYGGVDELDIIVNSRFNIGIVLEHNKFWFVQEKQNIIHRVLHNDPGYRIIKADINNRNRGYKFGLVGNVLRNFKVVAWGFRI